MFRIAQKGTGMRLLKGFVVDVKQTSPKHKVLQNSPTPLENIPSNRFGKKCVSEQIQSRVYPLRFLGLKLPFQDTLPKLLICTLQNYEEKHSKKESGFPPMSFVLCGFSEPPYVCFPTLLSLSVSLLS
jgi:hypothetical protein